MISGLTNLDAELVRKVSKAAATGTTHTELTQSHTIDMRAEGVWPRLTVVCCDVMQGGRRTWTSRVRRR